MLRNEGDRLARVVVSTPGDEYFGVSDCEAHNFNEAADTDRTRAQFGRLKSILEETGCDVVDRAELQGHPNSVFTRDVSLCTPRGFIKLRMGLESRRGEEEWMAQILTSLGEPLSRQTISHSRAVVARFCPTALAHISSSGPTVPTHKSYTLSTETPASSKPYCQRQAFQ